MTAFEGIVDKFYIFPMASHRRDLALTLVLSPVNHLFTSILFMVGTPPGSFSLMSVLTFLPCPVYKLQRSKNDLKDLGLDGTDF